MIHSGSGVKARKTQKSLFWYNSLCNEYESVFDRVSMKSTVDMVWNGSENRKSTEQIILVKQYM